MTLAFRNRTIFAYIITALLLFAALVVFTVLFQLRNGFSPMQYGIRLLPVFRYTVPAVIASIYSLILYIAAAGFTVYFMFEKTQSSEIIYFCVFLFSCLFEGLRFFILLLDLADMHPDFILFAARGVFFGRICASLTFLIASLFCSGKLEQDPERTCYLIFAAGVVTAILIPFNTAQITTNAMLTYGYMYRIFFIRVLFAGITFFCFFFNSITGEIREFRKIAYGFIFLYTGYILLTIADAIAVFVTGSLLLALGTWLFLSNLHRYYLWK